VGDNQSAEIAARLQTMQRHLEQHLPALDKRVGGLRTAVDNVVGGVGGVTYLVGCAVAVGMNIADPRVDGFKEHLLASALSWINVGFKLFKLLSQ
jgi:hypothetical protein